MVSVTSFTGNGEERARAIKAALEEKYLDKGAAIGTIHVLSNSQEHFGTSTSALFSFASLNGMYTSGEASLHEIAHSIGRLKDEYGAVKEGVNASRYNDANIVQWKKFLGFRGVGIINNENSDIYFAPTRSCIMMKLENSGFCEVCRAELATRMNLGWYTQKPEEYYVAAPDITIEHSTTSAVGKEYDKYRINEKNIVNASGHDLELRTVVQNFKNKKRQFKLSLEITDINGNRKLYQEKYFTLAPLVDEYHIDEARMSMSVTLESVSELSYGDKIIGLVTDADTNTVVASDKTADIPVSRINIGYELENSDGTVTAVPNTYPTVIYARRGSVYRLNPPSAVNGCVYVGTNAADSEIKIDGESTEIVYRYKLPSDIKRAQVSVSEDGAVRVKLHNIDKNSCVALALYTGDTLARTELFNYDGSDIVCDAEHKYTSAKVMVFDGTESLRPLCRAETVTLN